MTSVFSSAVTNPRLRSREVDEVYWRCQRQSARAWMPGSLRHGAEHYVNAHDRRDAAGGTP